MVRFVKVFLLGMKSAKSAIFRGDFDFIGAGGGSRTPTRLPSPDFEYEKILVRLIVKPLEFKGFTYLSRAFLFF